MIVRVDMDGTICTAESDYAQARPRRREIARVNALYAQGHTIIVWAGRGGTTGIDYRPLTRWQLDRWGVRYHMIDFDKPYFDVLIDDKAMLILTEVEDDGVRKSADA